MIRMRRPRLSVPVVLYLLIALVVAASFGALLHRQSETARQNRAVLAGLQEQNAQVRALLERQEANDANRQQLIDEAVAAIAAEQYRALVAHDHRTERLLRQLLSGQKAAPGPAIPKPAPFVGPRATQPAPQPAPAPAPKPPPCEKAGNSGKCKK